MPRFYLEVPFNYKEYAKQFGAKWDVQAKSWYVPDGEDLSALAAFVPRPINSRDNIVFRNRCNSFFLLVGSGPCWSCTEVTTVYGLLMPGPWQGLIYHVSQCDDVHLAQNPCSWITNFDPMIPTYIKELPPAIEAELARLAPTLYDDFSSSAGHRYRMNHCGNCNAKIGDGNLHKNGGLFQPTTIDGCCGIEMIRIDRQILLNAWTEFPTPVAKDLLRIAIPGMQRSAG